MSYLKIDTTIKPIYARSIEEFNEYVKKYETKNDIILTKSNNISQQTLRHMPASKSWKRGNHFEFQYIDSKTHIRVIYNIRNEDSERDPSESYDALNYFNDKNLGSMLNVIPTDYCEQKTEIFRCPENKDSKYYNYVNPRYLEITVNNCYSLDLNSAFLDALVKVYPATRKWVEKVYKEKLSGNDKAKLYANMFIGWLKNPRMHRENAWSKIINYVNIRIHNFRKELEKLGCKVLLVNTDAIKFIAPNYFTYHTSNELGDFKFEYKNAKMYIKGVKSYAYWTKPDASDLVIKQAGETKLDKIKPRNEWTLKDFKEFDILKIRYVRINKNTGLLEEYYE